MEIQTNRLAGINGLIGYRSVQKSPAAGAAQESLGTSPLDLQDIPASGQSKTQAPSAGNPATRTNPLYQQLYEDVRQVAEKAGYVGLTQSDVARAYATGSSLLADYHA